MTEAPILLLGFNRPDRLAELIDSVRPFQPTIIRVAIDGPRSDRVDEIRLTEACRREVERIDWTKDVDVLARNVNLGIERAIPDAVTWVLSDFDKVIVIEDDVRVGPQFIPFANACLDRFERNEQVMHISGYNVVPHEHLSMPDAPYRFSRVPESLAWATWKRAWEHYNPSLDMWQHNPRSVLENVVGSTLSARRWKQNFELAHRQLISTWAYRWTSSMWQRDGLCVSPNRNLVTYRGYEAGTHTRRKARWLELPIVELDITAAPIPADVDAMADRYLHRQVFNSTLSGVALGPAERIALQIVKKRKR